MRKERTPWNSTIYLSIYLAFYLFLVGWSSSLSTSAYCKSWSCMKVALIDGIKLSSYLLIYQLIWRKGRWRRSKNTFLWALYHAWLYWQPVSVVVWQWHRYGADGFIYITRKRVELVLQMYLIHVFLLRRRSHFAKYSLSTQLYMSHYILYII